MTFNPHLENYSKSKLLENFKYAIQKYYRKELGRRYYKHINNQYDVAIFEENGKKFYERMNEATHLKEYIEMNVDFKKEPHLHIIADVPLNKATEFFNTLKNTLESMYLSLTTDFDLIATKVDERNVWNYCTKEGENIFDKKDLCEKSWTTSHTDS